MKIAAIVIVALLVVATGVADYKWKKWMAERKRERE